MLIIIFGEDTYRSREWLRELQLKFKSKFDANGYNLISFSGNDELVELRGAITAPPFLGSRRMVVVERLFEQAGRCDDLESVLNQIPETTIVIVWEEGNEKTFAKISLFAKFLRKKTTKIYSFPLLREIEVENWAKTQAKKLNISFERGALGELARRVGSDLWQFSSELEKFAASGEVVTKIMIQDTVLGKTPENIFVFTDAFVAHDKRRVISELANLRANKITVPYFISMLARQFRILQEARSYLDSHSSVSSQELAEVFGWHPFVAKKTLDQVKKFKAPELVRAAEVIFQAERSVKTGFYDADAALDLLVAQLLKIEIKLS